MWTQLGLVRQQVYLLNPSHGLLHRRHLTPVQVCQGLGDIFDMFLLGHWRNDICRRPGALIAGCWALMQYMGARYVSFYFLLLRWPNFNTCSHQWLRELVSRNRPCHSQDCQRHHLRNLCPWQPTSFCGGVCEPRFQCRCLGGGTVHCFSSISAFLNDHGCTVTYTPIGRSIHRWP